MTDEHRKMIDRARRGDRTAFNELVRTYGTQVFSTALHIAGAREDADDIAQDVFVRLYRSICRYDPKFLFSTWLYRVTVNCAYDHLRRNARHRHEELEEAGIEESGGSPVREFEETETRRIVTSLLGGLTFSQRTVFVLRDLQGCSTKEIAKIVESSVSTVRVHLSNARERLRILLRERYPELLQGVITERSSPQ